MVVNSADRIAELESENAQPKARIMSARGDEEPFDDYDDDVWEDGYHEVRGGSGAVIKKGVFENGHLIDGT